MQTAHSFFFPPFVTHQPDTSDPQTCFCFLVISLLYRTDLEQVNGSAGTGSSAQMNVEAEVEVDPRLSQILWTLHRNSIIIIIIIMCQ